MKHKFYYYNHTKDERCVNCKMYKVFYISEIENIIFDYHHIGVDLNKIIEEKLPCLTDDVAIIKEIIE